VGLRDIGVDGMNDLLANASEVLQLFKGDSLSDNVAKLERDFVGASGSSVSLLLTRNVLTADLLAAALLIKRSASQINEIVHSLGILLALPSILDSDERVEALSLAAGNTGKNFDLQTDKRIAEFTFIEWQGGPEVIRQNKVFKDFYFLAEAETDKVRELYVIGTQYVAKFFNSNRAIPRILAGNAKLGESFRARYGTQYSVVREYYRTKKEIVRIKDVTPYLPKMSAP
jgi:hypothetical protein